MVKEYIANPATLRLQYSIKFAVAGVLTLYCVRWLRLDSPTWALATVVVLMIAHYVGVMVEKAFFRLAGTITGALLGIALVGNFLGNGPLLLALVFILLTFFGCMFAGTRAPYAFLLSGLTMLIVISACLFSPNKAWSVGLSRTMDIGVGIVVTLVVSTVLWPRHARVEFYLLVTKMLRSMEDTLREAEKSLHKGSSDPQRLAEIEAMYLKDTELLQKLMLFGARESSAFATRVPSYEIIINRLNYIYSVTLALANTRHSESVFAKRMQHELETLLSAIESEGALLHESLTQQLPPRIGTLESVCEAFTHRIEVLHAAGVQFKSAPVEIASFAGFATGFLELAIHLRVIREELVRLFGSRRYQPPPFEKKTPLVSIDPTGILPACKGALMAVFALIFCNWLHPPGASLIPAAGWLFIMLPRSYFYGNSGQKAIHYTFLTGLIGIPALGLFSLLSPLIANYFSANIFLFVSFFLFGWIFFELGYLSQIMYATTLAIAGAVNLCNDWPIPPGGFQEWYFGILLAVGFMAFVQRFFWPPLPQNSFFRDCQRYFSGCLALIASPFGKSTSTDSLSPKIFQTAWSARAWIDVLPLRACASGEQTRLHELFSQMQSTGYQLTMFESSLRYEESQVFFSKLGPRLAPLQDALRLDLSECYQAFENRNTPPFPSPPRPSPAEPFCSLYQTLRNEAFLKIESTPVVMEVFGKLCHLETAACAAWNCRQMVSKLQLEYYANDVAM